MTTDSEFNLLGFHLGHKLYVPDDVHFMLVHRDFGIEIDKYFAAKESGSTSSIEFLPLEERVGIPAIRALIAALKAGPPEIAGVTLELFDFSEEALREVADNIAMVRAQVRAGKPFKAFSPEFPRCVEEAGDLIAEFCYRNHGVGESEGARLWGTRWVKPGSPF